MASVDSQATRSTLQSVDTTLSENITATQNYIPVVSTTNFSTSVVAEIESTNEVVSFTDISENRLPHSKNLNVPNGYSINGVSITINQGPTPENTNTATKITINNASSPHTFGYFSLSIASPTAFTASYYVKNVSGSGYVQLRSASGGKNGYFVNFDIVNGITGTKGSNINSSSITDVGNGWFRISMTSNTTSHTLTGAEVCFTEGTSSLELPTFVGNGTDSYLIWGSQIELDTTLSTLLPTEATVPLFGLTAVTRGVNGTTAQAASSGDSIQQLPFAFQQVLGTVTSTLSEDIDATQNYVPVASTSGFVKNVDATIESTNEVVSFTDLSENQIIASENLGSASYQTLSSATLTDAQATSPAGTNNAWQLDIATANNSGVAVDTRNKGFGVGDVVTASVFVKSVSGANQDVRLLLSDGTGSSLTSHTATSEWQRISITRTFAGTGTANGLQLRNAAAGGTKSIYAWGFQIEQLGSPSTYLPTDGTALFGLTNVTRGVKGTTAQAASSGASVSQTPSLASLNTPIRLRGLSISPDGTGAARLTLCDNNGDSILDIDTPDGKVYTMNMPEAGLVFPNGVFVSNTENVTAYTLYTEKYSGPGLTAG